MQNKASLADTPFFSRYPCSSIDKGTVSTRYQHLGYVKGDIFLDIIKEGLIEKRRVIDGPYPPRLTFQRLEFSHANSDEGTWNLGRALCRQLK